MMCNDFDHCVDEETCMSDNRPGNKNNEHHFNKSMDAVERFVPVEQDDSGRQVGRTQSEIAADDLSDD